jgi:hypothetical protein
MNSCSFQNSRTVSSLFGTWHPTNAWIGISTRCAWRGPRCCFSEKRLKPWVRLKMGYTTNNILNGNMMIHQQIFRVFPSFFRQTQQVDTNGVWIIFWSLIWCLDSILNLQSDVAHKSLIICLYLFGFDFHSRKKHIEHY